MPQMYISNALMLMGLKLTYPILPLTLLGHQFVPLDIGICVSLAIFVSQIGDLHIEKYIICKYLLFVAWGFLFWDFLGNALLAFKTH